MSIQDMETAARQLAELEQQLNRVVIGQQKVVRETLVAILAGGHVLIEGIPGLGKTLLARALAKSLGGQYSRIQFTPDLMPADISGHALFDFKSQEFHVQKGPVFCNFLLADEINRASAKTQSALLEAMQERQVTIEGTSYSLEQPFIVMATQNSIEQEGTYPLPQAQLDRFLFKVLIDYPNLEEEVSMVRHVTGNKIGDSLDVSELNVLLSSSDVSGLQQLAATARVDDQIHDYAVRIVQATREWPGIETGAGPRGSLVLVRAARAAALLNQRGFVTPDDVKAVAHAGLRHRIYLTADLEIEGEVCDRLIGDLLNQVDAPRT